MISKSIISQYQSEKNLYYLSTESTYLADITREIFCDFFCADKGFICERYTDGKVADIIAKAEMPSFFSEKKLIILDKFTSGLDEKDKMILKALPNVLSDESGYILLIIETGAAFAPFTKQFIPLSTQKYSSSEMSREIKEIFDKHGINADIALCSNIFDLSGQNIDYAINEINKLIGFTLSSGEVTKADVELIVLPNIDKSVFVLINCLSKCNFAQAMIELNLLQRRNISPPIVLSSVLSSFRRMMFCLFSKLNVADLAKALGVKDAAIRIAMDNARGYTQVKLKQIVEFIINCEFEFKSGVMKEEQVLTNVVSFIVATMSGSK